jgi:soluble lytic murein transglycosylase-like protein
MHIGNCILAVLLAVPLASQARAEVAVVFSDGRSMTVDRVEREEATLVLFLEGGGALSVPAERISHWDDLSRAEPVPRADSPRAAEDSTSTGSAWQTAAGPYAELIGRTAREHGLDPVLLTAVAQVESRFDPQAVSPAGARGLLQLMPATADRFGVGDVFDATENVQGGARYLSWLLERYDGRTDLALAGYNAGEAAVDKHSGIPPYRETRRYVRRVMEGASRLAELAP